MDELRRAMLDAGAPPDEWQAELPFLIEAGQKRVRRRRMIATGVAAAVVTVIGTTAALAGVPGLNKSDPDPVKDRHSGVYIEERISATEVERRCNVVLSNQGSGNKTFVAGVDKNGRAVPAAESVEPIENRVGRLILLAPQGTEMGDRPPNPDPADTIRSPSKDWAGPVFCTIPQAATLDSAGLPPSGPLPASDDSGGVAEACTRSGGYDLRGWALLVAARVDGIRAIFMSKNGYAAICSLSTNGADVEFYPDRFADDGGRPLLPAGDTGRRDPDRYSDLEMTCPGTGAEGQRLTCSAIGVLPGLPDGYRIEVRFADGTTTVTETHRGAYVVAIEPQQAELWPRPILRVRAPDGVIVWKTPPGAQSPDASTGGGSGGGAFPGTPQLPGPPDGDVDQ
jgi:hypothetical protein